MVLDRPSAVTGLYGRHNSVVERRRTVFFRLLGTLGFAGFVAALFGGIFWYAFLLVLLATGAYVALLARLQLHRAEVERKIHHLPSRSLPYEVAPSHPGEQFAVGGGPGPSGTVRVRSWQAE